METKLANVGDLKPGDEFLYPPAEAFSATCCVVSHAAYNGHTHYKCVLGSFGMPMSTVVMEILKPLKHMQDLIHSAERLSKLEKLCKEKKK